ncbi:MAG: galactokinase [Lachnospiraceae bacterium]|nr:galactokinase [Lachnospiraceae bacterium]
MLSSEAVRALKNNEYKELLKDIYVDEAVLEHQRTRYIEAVEKFEELYGEKEISIYSAPGRTEICGNHTDHQHGAVLAAAINLDIIAVVVKTDDNIIKVMSGTYDIKPISMNELKAKEEEKGTSEALIRGVAARFSEDGYNIGGFKAYMTSEVMGGSGLSSSAAFEVLIGTILSGLYNDMTVSPVYIAQASQYSENEYFGKPCGLMDQMASSVGSLVNIDFKDPGAPIVNKLSVDFDKFGHALCIVDIKGDHSDLTPEYAAVTVEMRKVSEFFGCNYLREVDPAAFYEKLPEVRKQTGDRAVLRAIHFFADHERVGKQVKALEKGDFEEFKKLIIESGDSSFKYLQNVYAASDVQNQGVPIGLALSEKILEGRGAYRIHGGGFGGTIQVFVPNELVDEYKTGIEKYFGEGACHVLRIRKYGGRAVLS